MVSPSDRAPLSRRGFIALLGAGAGAAVLTACGGAAATATSPKATQPAAAPAGGGGATATTGAPATVQAANATAPAGKLQGSVTFWTQNYGTPEVQKKLMDDLVAKYKADRGVDVKYEIVNWSDASNKWNLSMKTGDVPDAADVFFLQSRVVAGANKWGPIALDDDLKSGVLGDPNRFYPLGVEESKYEGKWYGLPWRFDVRLMNYRTDYFEAAGLKPPTTTDEVIDVAKKLTKPDGSQYGVALTSSGAAQTSYHHAWMLMMHLWDVPMLTPDLKSAAFNTPAAREALQWAADLTFKHKVTPTNLITPGYESNTEYMAGRVAMTFPAGSGFPVTQRASAPQLAGKYAGALVPKGKARATLGFTAPIVVFQNTKNRAAATDWLRYFTSTPTQVAISTAYELANSSKDVMADGFFQSNQWWKAVGEQAQYAKVTDQPTPAWGELSAYPGGPIYEMMNEVLAGRPVGDLFPKYEAKFNEILKKYN